MLRAAVLAGGQSSRMGRDKALLELHGQSLLERAIALLQATGAEQVLVSGRPEHPQGVPDLLPHCGPPGALLSLLSWLHERQGLDGAPLLLIPVDMPLLTLPTLQTLLRHVETGHGGQFSGEIFPCVFPASLPLFQHLQQLFRDARHLGGQRSLRSLLAFVQATTVDMGTIATVEFRNLNTPQDWQSVLG